MAFFDEVKKWANPVTYYNPDTYSGGGGGGSGSPRTTGHTYIERKPTSTSKDVSDFIGKIYGVYNTEGTRAYGNVFDQAYEDLGQPLRDTNRDEVYAKGTHALATSFVDRYHKKTGKVPSVEDVQKFVAQNLTPSFAEKFILGVPGEQIDYGIADPYIENLPPEKPAETQAVTSPLEDKLSGIYDRLEESAGGRIARRFAPLRSRAIEEEASLGRLRSPISLDPNSPIQQQDKLQAEALSDTIGNIMQQRATGELDIARIGQGERQMAQQADQFGRTLSLDRDKFRVQAEDLDKQRRNERRAQQIASEIGRLQAKGKEPGVLDYLNTALQGAGTAAMGYAAFCWVAEELYGKEAKQTHTIRKFLISHLNELSPIGRFARTYAEKGSVWAEMIKSPGPLRDTFKSLYDGFYRMAVNRG